MTYIPLSEVAERLRVDVATVRRWCRQERPLKSAKIGGQWVTTQEWLDEFAVPVGVDPVARDKVESFKRRWAK